MPSPFANRDFLLLFSIGALQSAVRWLELLAFGVYVFDLTNSAVIVTMVTLAKFAPLALFGVPAGVLPATFPSRSLYLYGLILMILTNILGLVLVWSGSLSVLQILLISFTGGLFWVLDFPVRRALIGDAVSQSELGQTMAIDTIANNGTRMIGPVAGGALLQVIGLKGTFAVAIGAYILCFLLTLQLKVGRQLIESRQSEAILTGVANGIKLVRKQTLLLAVLLVTVAYNLFGFPVLSLIPVIGRDVLDLSPIQVGILASMEGAGAMAGSVMMFKLAVTENYRKLYSGGLLIFLVAIILYALSQQSIVIGCLLFIAGAGSAAFAAMQTTLLILNASREYRSRLFGLLSLSIGAGFFGFIFLGMLVYLTGAQTATFLSGIFGIVALILIVYRWPDIIGKQQ